MSTNLVDAVATVLTHPAMKPMPSITCPATMNCGSSPRPMIVMPQIMVAMATAYPSTGRTISQTLPYRWTSWRMIVAAVVNSAMQIAVRATLT
ncbi:hypothetical protein D3C74_400990 [compost metagenome]